MKRLANGAAVPRRMRTDYKRPFDLALLAVAFVAVLPLWMLLAIAVPVAIRLDSPGPALYRQRRAGRDGRVFEMLKYRTMRDGAEDATGAILSPPRDARVTRVGRFLRRWHVDELPQALNMLRGEMSIVGPRPERPELMAACERAAPGFARRLAVRPGVIGLAQARGGYHLPPRRKLRYDELYMRRMGPWLDLRLCLLCAAGLLVRRSPAAAYTGLRAGPRRVDYLLVAGPGRSGTTYLFEGLKHRPGFAPPVLKEAACYRAPRRLRAARRRAPVGAVLLDAPNLAWRDARLRRLRRLGARGCRTLLVVLLRDHRERGRSMKAFRASRGHWRALFGDAAVERGVLRDSLAPADLARLFDLGVDVACVEFEALVRRPGEVFDAVTALCGVPVCGGDLPSAEAVNGAVVARSRVLSAAGKATALALRALGCRRLLARAKANARLRRLFFRPAAARPAPLSPAAEAALGRLEAECRAVVEAATEPVADGLRLKRSRGR